LNIYIQTLLDRNINRLDHNDLLIIGHSLGGGLAKIVGVTNNVTAISISGPGILLSRHKFGLSKTGIMYSFISFKYFLYRFSFRIL
jgi:lipase ATG15